MSDKKWKDYALNNIPIELHKRMKDYAIGTKTTMRQLILDAVEEKLANELKVRRK